MTGGGGFIDNHLVSRSLVEGCRVRVWTVPLFDSFGTSGTYGRMFAVFFALLSAGTPLTVGGDGDIGYQGNGWIKW